MINDLSTGMHIVQSIDRKLNYNDLYQLTFPDVDKEYKHNEFWKKHSLRRETDCLQWNRVMRFSLRIGGADSIFAKARLNQSSNLLEFYNIGRAHTLQDFTKSRLPLYARNMFTMHSEYKDYL